jgi:hypothetical protein
VSSPRSISGSGALGAGMIALVLAVSVLVVHAKIALGGKTWDDVRYHTEIAPPRLAASDAMMSGVLPGWWEGSGLGVPLIGEPSHGAAYPAVWLATSPHALDLVWLAHAFWLALGLALWARRLGAGEVACVLAGVIVAASGIVASAALRGAIPALAHVPWVGWAALGIAQATDPRARMRAAAALGLLLGAIGLSGQLAIFIDALALACVVGLTRSSWRANAIAVGAGLAIACVQWLPALLAIGDTAGAHVHALRLSRMLELVAPGSFGSTSPDHAVTQLAGAHAEWPSLYVGAAAFSFALAARMPLRTTILLIALVILALVAGRGGWPGWAGAPDCHLGVLAVIACALASRGIDAALDGERRGLVALIAAAGVSALALGALAVLRTKVEAPALDRALIDGGLGVACLAAAFVVAWRHGERPLSRLVIAALVVAPSVGALGSTAPLADRSIVETTPLWAEAASTVPMSGAPRRVFRPVSLFEDTTPGSLRDAIASLSGTSQARHGIGAARSEDPARPPSHDRVWLAAASGGGALLARYGITLAILPAGIVEGGKVAELARRGNFSLVKYPASPAASMVTEWIWIPDDAAAIARLFPPGGRGLPMGLVVLHGSGVDHQDEPSEPEPCTVSRWTAGAIDMTCVATLEAQAVVSSSPARGWTVHVAGHDTPWVTADVLRRAVALSPGAYVVSWRFVPPGIYAGAGLALVALLVLAGYAAVVTRRYRRDRESRETN